MNLYIFCGRPIADPDIRYSSGQKQTCVANFTLAVDRKYKRDNEATADFFKCVAFGKTAEVIEKHVSKGTKIIVTGEAQNDNYEKDGVKHYGIKFIVSQIEFAENRKNAAETNSNSDDGFMPIPTGIDPEMPFA